MGFLIGEIALFLAAAAVVGVLIGWGLFGGKKATAGGGAAKAAPDLARLTKLQNDLRERDTALAETKEQLAIAEEARVESAGRLEQSKGQVSHLQNELRERDAELAVMAKGDTNDIVADFRAKLANKDAEIERLNRDLNELNPGDRGEARMAQLKSEVSELRAILESGGQLTGTVEGGGEQDAVIARLQEEITGLKAAYDAAERSLEEQDGAIDDLTQKLIRSQQRIADLESARGESTVANPPVPAPIVAEAQDEVPSASEADAEAAQGQPEAAAAPAFSDDDDAEEQDEATMAMPAFDLPEDEPPASNGDEAATEEIEEDDEEQDEATMAMPAFDLPDDDDEEQDEATMAMPAFDLPDDDEDDDEEQDEATMAMPAFALPADDQDQDVTMSMAASDLLAKVAELKGDEADDLKQIKGVGPAIEKRLHEAGFTTWAQIAVLDDEGVADMAARVRVSVDKIKRDGWVESAKGLLLAPG